MAGAVRVCSWEDVSFSDAETLLELSGDSERLQTHLVALLSKKGTRKGEKQAAIELDLFTYAVLFCKKNQFSLEQLSAFFTILKSVHCMCVSTPYDNFQETVVFFRELLLRHCVQRPPFSKCLYSLSQVKAITDYVLSTYFKHFKMYKFAFTERVLLSLSFQYTGEPEEEEGEEEEVVAEGSAPSEAEEDGREEREDTDGKEEEDERKKEPEDPEQERLRNIITSTLTTHLKQLKVSVEQKMSEHESRMTDKISQLEALSDHKSKKK